MYCLVLKKEKTKQGKKGHNEVCENKNTREERRKENKKARKKGKRKETLTLSC